MKPQSFFHRRFNLVSLLKTDRWRAVRRTRNVNKYISPTLAGIAWLDAIANLVFTPQGRILLIAFLPLAFFALLLTRSPAFLLFLLVALMFLLDWAGKLFFPRRLRIERHPPARVVCGVPFVIRTEIRNESFLPAYDFLLNENLEGTLVRQEEGQTLYCLSPHSEMAVRQRYLLKRRGIYALPPAIAEGVFPFRLIKASRRGKIRQEIICHPAWTEFQELHLPGGIRLTGAQDMSVSSRTGVSQHFAGCREYRNGDDPRLINWPASARRNRLVVKEFQEEQQSSAAVILDNCCPAAVWKAKEVLKRLFTLKSLTADNEEPFEAAVSLTASIARSLSIRNFVIDVFAFGSEIHHFRTGRNTMSFEAFLDLLASLDSSHSEKRFDGFPASELDRAADAGAVFLILLRIDPEAEKLYGSLLKRGANLRVFTFDQRADLPGWAERLSCGEILLGSRREL